MASKELIAQAAKAMEERRKELIAQPLSRIYPQLAEAAISTILAALQEPTEGMIDVVPVPYRCGRDWRQDAKATYRSMLAHSPLGEKAE